MKRTLKTGLNLLLAGMLIFPLGLNAQKKKKSKEEKKVYEFETVHEVPYTPVKDQQRTGTCWSFATTSFIEAELLRLDKGVFDLSEMYFVRYAYTNKAIAYFRRHGKGNYSEGGQAHDVMKVVKEHGFMPEEFYLGNNYKGEFHQHSEMVSMTKGMLDGVIKNKRGGVTPRWLDAVNATLDIYLGEVPETFKLKGKTYSPAAFAHRELAFNADDYVEITSFTHHPYYETFDLEVPDNWSNDHYYNVPMNELMAIMKYAIKNGYSVCWDGDVSEPGFSHKDAVAVVAEEDSKADLFKKIVPEQKITQEMRQELFDRLVSTDDHLMHIVGISKDQEGNHYFITKNSWSENSNYNGGLLNMSEAYVQLKTIAIMVHKDAVPDEIAAKLHLK